MKRIIAMLLAMMMLFTSGGEILAAELDNSPNVTKMIEAKKLPVGTLEPEITAIPETEMPEGVSDSKENISINKYSKVYDHKWDKYGTNYYYNQLSKEEKKLWDDLETVCNYYLKNEVDIYSCMLDVVKLPYEMTAEELKNFWQLFMHSNPQYYFLSNGFSYNYSYYTGNATSLILRCYQAFADGYARAEATENVQAQINKWEKIVKGYDTDEEKLKAIFDLVCNKVTYNYDFIYGYVDEEDCFSQSSYSVFCTDTTVCAGYADAMSVMCNAFDIDAVAVTSVDHQWNKIRLNDIWYNYDATWGDQDGYGIYYEYYARSDARYESDGYSHIEEGFYEDYSPNAIVDVVPSSPWNGPGEYPEINDRTATPKIKKTSSGDGYKITITCDTSNATIYYTTDGTDPTSAYAKANEYKGAFTVDKNAVVKAIAVHDGYLDSKIASSNSSTSRKSIEDAKVKLSATKYYYDGKTKKPTVTVTLNGKTLKKDTDYTVKYKNNKSIGKSTVTITGINKYKGTITKNFTITVKKGKKIQTGDNKYEILSSSTVAFTSVKSSKVTKVKIPNTITYGGATFKVTEIAANALKGKTKVTQVTIGANVKTIGAYAFKGCTALKSITIPSKVTKIDKQAFYGCKNLKTITIKSTALKTVGKDAFKKIYSKATIKVPKKKLTTYKKMLKKAGVSSKAKYKTY